MRYNVLYKAGMEINNYLMDTRCKNKFYLNWSLQSFRLRTFMLKKMPYLCVDVCTFLTDSKCGRVISSSFSSKKSTAIELVYINSKFRFTLFNFYLFVFLLWLFYIYTWLLQSNKHLISTRCFGFRMFVIILSSQVCVCWINVFL